MASVASTSSTHGHNYDFTLDTSAPMLNLPRSEKFGSVGSPDGFSKELSRLQEEQMYFSRKIEKEKIRKEVLDHNYQEALSKLRDIQDKTKNGTIVKEHDIVNKKLIGRLEHHLQMSKIKLSVSRNENLAMKKRVQELRRDKLLHLQILNDLVKEANEAKKKLKHQQKEITSCNERKHKAKMAMTNIKNKMLKDMEEFSHELNLAKANISNAQTNIIAAMREKMLTTQLSPGRYSPLDTSRTAATVEHNDGKPEMVNQGDLVALLQEAGFSTTEELIAALETSEETVFALYSETQQKEDEMERIDVDNKHLEQQVELQLSRLHALEGHHEEVKQELEKNIQSLRNQISKYDTDYNKNMEVLTGISDNLMNLLRNVAQDEAAGDQQLLSAGVNDRNVEDFLGLIEQRIDDLIQMSKAAHHQSIRRDDFLKVQPADKAAQFHVPHLPSLHETNDDDDGEYDDTVKLQPINIAVLKELMSKKVQKAPQRALHKGSSQLGNSASQSGMRSRQSSFLSIKSTGSHKSTSSK